MKRLDQLKKSALESCSFRGHKMGKFEFTLKAAGQGVYGGWTCVKCGKRAAIDTNPAPNGIDISGDAVATNCKNILENEF